MRTRNNDWDMFIEYEAKQWRQEQERLKTERFAGLQRLSDDIVVSPSNVQEPSESLGNPQVHDQ